MANPHGDWIWYELLTDDLDNALAFYKAVIGWDAAGSGQEGVDYRILSMPDGAIGGAMAISPQMAAGGMRPGWLGYIGVDDADRSVGEVTDAGGAVLMPAMTMPGVGRMALVADGQGAPFYVMRGESDETSMAFAWDKPRLGHCAWNELATADPDAAKAFYGKVFDWSKDGEMTGPVGLYEFWRSAGGLFGAVMRTQPDMPTPAWIQYFRVADIDAAYAAILARGGRSIHPPEAIPGGDHAVLAIDPQGATFGLVGERKGDAA